jgi:NADPH:quinone reductase-like Zn-dependent oxidoreductase
MTTQQTKYLVFESKTDAGKVLTKELNAPAKGQVLIRVSVSSVQSTDLFQLTGEYPGLKFPITTGYDVVGVIAQVGPDVTGFEVGDRVTYMSVTGGHSEYLLGDASRVVKLGADVASVPDSHITALTLSWMTAYQMVHRAGGR